MTGPFLILEFEFTARSVTLHMLNQQPLSQHQHFTRNERPNFRSQTCFYVEQTWIADSVQTVKWYDRK